MAQSTLTENDIRAMAAAIGLTRLTGAHLESLLRATKAAQARRGKLKVELLGYADEPAHVFSLEDWSAR